MLWRGVSRAANARSTRRGVVTGCVAAGVALVTTPTPGAQTDGATIRLTAVVTASRMVDVGARGRSPGDLEIVFEVLHDRHGSTVGHAQMLCTLLGRGARSCDATYVLPKGQIVAGAATEHRLLYELAITGGTGIYDNARGDLVVTALGLHPRRELLVIRLVDMPSGTPAGAAAVQPVPAARRPR